MAKKRIEITFEGRETIAAMYNGDRITKVGRAMCNPDDEYNIIIGTSTALARLLSARNKTNVHTVKKRFFSLDKFLGIFDGEEIKAKLKPMYAKFENAEYFPSKSDSDIGIMSCKGDIKSCHIDWTIEKEVKDEVRF